MIKKKNIPLIIALAIPVLMIVLVAAFIYLPGVGKYPKENFLYMEGPGSYYNNIYTVSGGRLVQNTISTTTPPFYPSPVVASQPPEFYLYDVTKNQATEISFTDAQKYSLDGSTVSANGYSVDFDSSDGGIFGGGPYENGYYLRGHNRSIKLNLPSTGGNLYDFQFLGWIQ